MIYRKEKVKDFPTNHLFADIWFLSRDSVMVFLSLYIKIVFHLLSMMSISIEWSAQGDKWLLRRGGEGALCRIGGHCSHHAHRTQYIHKHTTLTYFHNFSFLYFSYIFIFFHTFPYHGGHCSHHMHCTQYIHKHTTITYFTDVLAGPGRSYIIQKLCPSVDILLHNEM